MKQAIQEGFIIDVIAHYTPVGSYYRLVKTVEGDPEFDTKRAGKKLRRYVEDHDHAIRLKAEIMVDHFHEQVAGQRIGGQARAMVVTSSIRRAVSYYAAIRDYLVARKSPYQAIVAFSGEHEYGDGKVTESSMNGFSSSQIAGKFQEDPYRFLVCAEKFQTGLRRAAATHDVRGQDFVGREGGADAIAVEPGAPEEARRLCAGLHQRRRKRSRTPLRTTTERRCWAEETDANRLHDLQATLDDAQVYSEERVDELVELYLSGADRDVLDPILDRCVEVYREDLGRGSAGGVQGTGQGVPAVVWVPGDDPVVHVPGVGRSARSS